MCIYRNMEEYFVRSFWGFLVILFRFWLLGFLAFCLLLGFSASWLLGFSVLVGLCGFWWLWLFESFAFSPFRGFLAFAPFHWFGFQHPRHHQFLSGKFSLYLCLCMFACMYVIYVVYVVYVCMSVVCTSSNIIGEAPPPTPPQPPPPSRCFLYSIAPS